MIDMNKKYTSNGRPVRILCTDRNVPSKPVVAMTEDGNVEFYTAEGKWFLSDDCMNDLVEAWEPKEGDLCFFWDKCSTILVVSRFYAMEHGNYTDSNTFVGFKYCAPFTGTLPEALKGLKDGTI